MPALHWFCRRWRTGSDDFTWSGIGLGASTLAGGIVGLSLIGSDARIAECPLASVTFCQSLYGYSVIAAVAGVLLFALAVCSARGKIFEVNKRSLVPVLLYLVSAFFVAQFVVCCILASRVIYHNEVGACFSLSTRISVRAAVGLGFVGPAIFLMMMVLSFDPSGRKKFDSPEDYHQLWVERCNLLCCCYNNQSGPETFAEAAKTLALLFRGYDLVPSDIAAGLLLLQGYQTYHRYQRARKTVNFGPNPRGVAEVLSSQARYAHPLSAEQRLHVDKIHYFSKYFLGAYGWLLHTFMHPVLGLPQLLVRNCCRCCGASQRGGGGAVPPPQESCCACDVEALRQMTGLAVSDILLTSFANAVYQPCFYVAVDNPSNSVVVAVRGTMSLQDCITDVVASPAEVLLDASTGERGHVHSGMLQSANNILQVLLSNRIIESLLNGNYRNSNVVVLGHSLGAGTATILSILLTVRYPQLRDRFQCIAYCPPGGLLSETARNFCKPFLVGCFVGFDVVPRMSSQNFDHLRESILAALTHTTAKKAAVFCLCCCPSKLGERLPEFRPDNLNSDQMRVMRRVAAQCVPVGSAQPTAQNGPETPAPPLAAPVVALLPPPNLFHYVKMVREAPSACCPLNPDGGIMTRMVTTEVWCPMLAAPEEMSYVQCHPMMTLDHFPDRVFAVIRDTHVRLSAGELSRFQSVDVKAEDVHPLESVHPLAYAPISSAGSSTVSAYQSTA